MSVRLQAWDLLRRLLFPPRDDPKIGDGSATLDNTVVQTEMVQQANASFVTAGLWQGLRRSGLDGLIDDPVREYLDAFHAMNAERNERIRRQTLECVAALNRAGVVPMPLKGAAYLLSGLYAEPGERFLSDIDLLIPEAAASRASAALAGIGFRAAPSRFDYTEHHHLPTLIRTLNDVAVELHTAPVLPLARVSLSSDEIWAGATEHESRGCRWRTASVTDTAMLSFLHGEVVDRALARCVVDLRGFQDLFRLVDRANGEIDWERNRNRASRGGHLPTFRRYTSVFAQLTGRQFVGKWGGDRWRDRAYHSLLRSAVRWPSIQRWANDFQVLQARPLRQRYDIGESPIALRAYRIRAFGGIVRKRLRRRPGR
ncbi:MAG TPA: nucleotidyltransferase family protein [Gammaproteobacteria bacterium]|nr:nucleotidyltransferase family protein [Gammaproteobacteria bacterium]